MAAVRATRPRVRMTHEGYALRMPQNGVHDLTARITPDELLFLVTHFGLAEIDPDQWSLQIDGLVCHPQTMTLADLDRFSRIDVTSVHECAGSPLTPKEPKRRVGNVRWSGVALKDVLAWVGASPEATYVWSEGLEWGTFAGVEGVPFAKDLPLTKAPEALLATHLNGAPLSADRGGPVRLVVPGWYGTNSVKWLGRLTLADRRLDSPFTTRFYNDPMPDGPRPVWGIAPECVIVAPSPHTSLRAGSETEVWGWAWAEDGVAAVDFSADGGASWQPCAVEAPFGHSWQRFSIMWRAAAGRAVLMARCRDIHGQAQPASGARNAIHAIDLSVN